MIVNAAKKRPYRTAWIVTCSTWLVILHTYQHFLKP